MRYFFIAIGFFIVVVIIFIVFFTHQPKQEELFSQITQEEQTALLTLASHAGLSLEAIKPAIVGTLQYYPLSFAVQNGHLVEFHLKSIRLQDLKSLTAFTQLRWLSIEDSALESIEGAQTLLRLKMLDISHTQVSSLVPLNHHPSLITLKASHCPIKNLGSIEPMPQLTHIELNNTFIEDITILTQFPALRSLDVRNNQALIQLPNPTPQSWNIQHSLLKQESNKKETYPHPDNFVEHLPKTTGDVGRGYREGSITNTSFTVKGGIERVRGVVCVNRIPGNETIAGGDVTLELSVKTGTLRVYLKNNIKDPTSWRGLKSGYLYEEASPNHPIKIKGDLNFTQVGNKRIYEFTIESREEETTGIEFKIYKN